VNVEHTLVSLHDLSAVQRVEDELLFKRAYDRIGMFVDGDDPPLAIWAIRANGRGHMKWWGHEPPPRQSESMVKVVRAFDRLARPVTTGSWLIACGNWEPFDPRGACYDLTFAVWKDPAGDMPFIVDREEGPEYVARIADQFATQGIHAWRIYGESLIEAGITKDNMTNKVERDVGYRMEPVATLEDVLGFRPAPR
jgi:hypothetical protein